jgi:hypothetical protein
MIELCLYRDNQWDLTELSSTDRQTAVAMRLPLAAVGGLIGCALLALQPASAAHGGAGGGGMNSGVYNSSMMAVLRERQEKIKNCARLHPNFDSGSMTYVGRDGHPHRCP